VTACFRSLKAGALGLWGNTAIGLASTAPAYSLAATLGYVVLEVGDKAPAMFIVAFIPMLLVALAYRDLNRAAPDCGTVFTWGTKAFGPIVGWLGGWGLAVSGIIVLANVAEIAAIYLLRFFGLDGLAENPFVELAPEGSAQFLRPKSSPDLPSDDGGRSTCYGCVGVCVRGSSGSPTHRSMSLNQRGVPDPH
jgi:amino acid transporter